MSLTFSILHFLSPLILILFFKKIKKGHDLRNIPVLLLSLFVFLLSNIPILVHVYREGNFSYTLFSLINFDKIFLTFDLSFEKTFLCFSFFFDLILLSFFLLSDWRKSSFNEFFHFFSFSFLAKIIFASGNMIVWLLGHELLYFIMGLLYQDDVEFLTSKRKWHRAGSFLLILLSVLSQKTFFENNSSFLFILPYLFTISLVFIFLMYGTYPFLRFSKERKNSDIFYLLFYFFELMSLITVLLKNQDIFALNPQSIIFLKFVGLLHVAYFSCLVMRSKNFWEIFARIPLLHLSIVFLSWNQNSNDFFIFKLFFIELGTLAFFLLFFEKDGPQIISKKLNFFHIIQNENKINFFSIFYLYIVSVSGLFPVFSETFFLFVRNDVEFLSIQVVIHLLSCFFILASILDVFGGYSKIDYFERAPSVYRAKYFAFLSLFLFSVYALFLASSSEKLDLFVEKNYFLYWNNYELLLFFSSSLVSLFFYLILINKKEDKLLKYLNSFLQRLFVNSEKEHILESFLSYILLFFISFISFLYLIFIKIFNAIYIFLKDLIIFFSEIMSRNFSISLSSFFYHLIFSLGFLFFLYLRVLQV